MNYVLPIVLVGGGLAAISLLNKKQAIKRLEYSNPRVSLKKATLTQVTLEVTLDIRNPASSDVRLNYFTGDILYNGSKISSFSFDGQKVNLKARSITSVPFTLIISNTGAVSVLLNVYKSIMASTKLSTVIRVEGLLNALGADIPVAFNYDFAKNAISGIGKVESQSLLSDEIENYFNSLVSPGPRDRQMYATESAKIMDYMHRLVKAFTDVKISVSQNEIRIKYNNGKGIARIKLDAVRKEILLPKLKAIVKGNSISGIGMVKATLEFGSNKELEKYFYGKRAAGKVMFSKN